MASHAAEEQEEQSVPLLNDDPTSSSSTATMAHQFEDTESMKAQTDFREDITTTSTTGDGNYDGHMERVEVTEEDVCATQSADGRALMAAL